MKKVVFIAVIFFVVKGFTQANKSVEKSNYGTTLNMINEANKLAETNAPKSMQLATNALEKSIKEEDKTGEYHSYNTLGSLYYNIGNYAKASDYFAKARDGFAALNNEKGKAYAEKYLGLSLEKQKKYSEALKVNDAVDKRSTDNRENMMQKKYNSARLKSKAGRKDEAINELQTLSNEQVTPETKIDIYNELGELYAEKKDTVKAYNSYYKILDLENPPETRSNTFLNSQGYLNAARKVSDLNLEGGKIKENITIQNQLLKDGLKTKDSGLIQIASYNIGNSYLKQNDGEKAVHYFFQSVNLAHSAGNAKEELKSLKDLAIAYENLGQFTKALEMYKRYVQLADSLNSVQGGNDQASLALNQEFLKQEQRIKNLISSQEEKEASIRVQRNIVWGLTGGLIVFALLTWALVRNINQKKKANMVIRLQSLRTQMNPHFIFNSLNSVNNFIAKNDERSANKYLSDFSKLMRSVIKNSDQDFVSLASEIQTLGIYLELEHFRFGDKFDYSMEVAADVEPETVKIPPMLIQPYIENAIWHGLRYKEEKGILRVKFFIEDKNLYCTIYDNGIGRKRSSELKTLHQKSYQSTGIKNTKERIELLNRLHKTSLEISITDMEENGVGTGTLVKISLPYIMQYEEV